MKLKKFVKIKGYDNWFLLIEKAEDVSDKINEQMQERMIKAISKELTCTKSPAPLFAPRISAVLSNKLNYLEVLNKYGGPLLIRPVGSFMLLGKNKIERVQLSIDFPLKKSTVAICENDQEAESFWLEYLSNRFNDKGIKVINFFSSRSKESIKEALLGVEYITFSTTFTTTEWYERLIKLKGNNQKIIGYCHKQSMWDTVEKPEGMEIVLNPY